MSLITIWDLRKAKPEALQRLAQSLGVSPNLPRIVLEKYVAEALKRDEIRARAAKRKAAA